MDRRHITAWVCHDPRRNRPWGVRWSVSDRSPSGRRRTVTRWFPTRSDAVAFRLEQERSLNSPEPKAARVVTWSELLDAYDCHLALSAERHQQEAARIIAYFQTLTRPRCATDLTADMCRGYLAQRAAGRPTRIVMRWRKDDLGRKVLRREQICHVPSQSTLAKEWTYLASLFNWLVREGLLPGNPLANVPKPRPLARLITAPDDRDICRLLRVLPNPELQLHDPQGWQILILLAYVTAVRQTSLIQIRVRRPTEQVAASWIELLESGEALLHLCAENEKGKQRDDLRGLPAWLAGRIAKRIEGLPMTAARLFNYGFQHKQWDRIRRAAGVSCTFHALRAGSVTQTAVAAAVAAAQGHARHVSARVTTQHYLHLREVVLAAARATPEPPDLPPLPPAPAADFLATNGRRPANTE